MKVMAALGAGVVVGAAGWFAAEVPVTPVAVVDVNRVFQGYSRALKFNQDVQARIEKLQADLDQRKKDLQRDAEDVEAKFAPDEEGYEKARREIELKLSTLAMDAKSIDARIGREQVREMGAVYKEICAEAQRIAEARGYACVFAVDSEPIVVERGRKVLSATDLRLQMDLRSVLWAKPEIDLTKEVLASLEAAREKGK